MTSLRVSRRCLLVAAVALFATTGCDGAAPPTIEAETAPEPPSPVMSAETLSELPLRLGEPRTLRLELEDDLVAAIESLGAESAPERTLRLTLEGLVPPEEPVNVRVFVNTPGADAATSVEAPGYVADVGFFPLDDPAAKDFLLDLGAALAALPSERRTADGRFVDVTLIALPASDTVGPERLEPVEVPLTRVVLSAHPPNDPS